MPQQSHSVDGKDYEEFPWCDQEDMKKYHLVNWMQVCLPTASAGLGVRPIKATNSALLTKWLWRLDFDGVSPWKSILTWKYGFQKFGWDIYLARCKASGMWRAIATCVDKFKDGIKFKAGRGDRIKFLTDPWSGSSSLASQFPSLYRLSLRPCGNISEFYSTWVSKLCGTFLFIETYLTLKHMLLPIFLELVLKYGLWTFLRRLIKHPWPWRTSTFNILFYSWGSNLCKTIHWTSVLIQFLENIIGFFGEQSFESNWWWHEV